MKLFSLLLLFLMYSPISHASSVENWLSIWEESTARVSFIYKDHDWKPVASLYFSNPNFIKLIPQQWQVYNEGRSWGLVKTKPYKAPEFSEDIGQLEIISTPNAIPFRKKSSMYAGPEEETAMRPTLISVKPLEDKEQWEEKSTYAEELFKPAKQSLVNEIKKNLRFYADDNFSKPNPNRKVMLSDIKILSTLQNKNGRWLVKLAFQTNEPVACREEDTFCTEFEPRWFLIEKNNMRKIITARALIAVADLNEDETSDFIFFHPGPANSSITISQQNTEKDISFSWARQ